MTDIFSTNQPIDTAKTKVPVSVADLVGEGKKFADVEALARSKVEADAFIEQLKEELKGLRESAERDVNAANNLSALQAEIADLKAKLNKPAEPSPNTTGALTPGQLEDLVANVMTKKEQERTSTQNVATANDAVLKIAGSAEKAVELAQAKARELGMSIAELRAIAAKSPTAFIQLLGLSHAKPQDNPLSGGSNLNSAALPNTNGQPKKGTAAYYSNMRREMGNKAFFADVNLQKEIFNAKKSGLYDSQ